MGPNLSDSIIQVLKGGPMRMEEIAFRVRSSKAEVNENIGRLEKVKIVREKSPGVYELSKRSDIDLSRMYS